MLNQSQPQLRPIANMAQFFSNAGQLCRSYTRSEGAFPTRRHIAVFEYPSCIAEFDGQHWTFAEVQNAQH